MIHEGIKVPVAVQQRQAICDAVGGDHGIYGFTYRDAQCSQAADFLDYPIICGQESLRYIA
jgi:hypothetical protein